MVIVLLDMFMQLQAKLRSKHVIETITRSFCCFLSRDIHAEVEKFPGYYDLDILRPNIQLVPWEGWRSQRVKYIIPFPSGIHGRLVVE